MDITGKSLIDGAWQTTDESMQFKAFYPEQNEFGEDVFFEATSDMVTQACQASYQAFKQYRQLTAQERAIFLNTIAENILALGDELIQVTMRESGLPEQRLQGERMRTVNQLRLFASELESGKQTDIVEAAQPDRQPLPKPSTRLTHLPVGPVAVFGASNFPYAFSVLGGDTASALAAGCPVVVKGHPAHPVTSELMATAILRAIDSCNLPAGVFALLQASAPQVSHQLVANPNIKAVGFTGSFAVANSLLATIKQRRELIPFYGELGSINPQILLPELINQKAEVLATNLVGSMMMGQGQFCTSPGVWFVPKQQPTFFAQVEEALASQPSAPLLTPGILASYQRQTKALRQLLPVGLVGANTPEKDHYPVAQVVATDLASFAEIPELQEEVFGPFAVIVEYDDLNAVVEFIEQLPGQLTASIHGNSQEIEANQTLVEALSYRVGRLIYNQMPTGVEVCVSMNHGGPYPSSTDVKSTSVGLEAKQRFVRPICIQGE